MHNLKSILLISLVVLRILRTHLCLAIPMMKVSSNIQVLKGTVSVLILLHLRQNGLIWVQIWGYNIQMTTDTREMITQKVQLYPGATGFLLQYLSGMNPEQLMPDQGPQVWVTPRTRCSLLDKNQYDYAKQMSLSGNAFIRLNIVKGLSVKSLIGINQYGRNDRNIDFVEVAAAERGTYDSFGINARFGLNWTWTNTLEYSDWFQVTTVLKPS